MWGGNRGDRAYITVYMILGEKSGKRRHFHILKKKNYVTSGHISQSIWKLPTN